jgi:Tol biopolymer transport system component
MRALVLAAFLAGPAAAGTVSSLNVIAVAGGAPVTVAKADGIFEAPNWAPDQKSFVINQDGRFYRVARDSGTRQPFDTAGLKGCWGEHGFSPDGKWFALSCPAPGEKGPDVHLIPMAGGATVRLTQQPISFFHGWALDGQTIAFTSIRGDHIDIYTVPATGGAPIKLTETGLNDGAEFAADGYLYFNSNRSGSMQIWRMGRDGSGLTQITNDGFDNWYPHPSPDGKWIAILSYAKGDATNSHPMDKPVALRLYSLRDGSMRILTTLTGGQGTFDSPCWSPDSTHIAYVSYQP